MAIELASAYVSIVPSIKGMRQTINDELGDAADQAADAGEGAGDGFTAGFGGKLAAFGAAAGLALGAALTKGTIDAIGREAENDLLAARLGLSPEESERIGRISGDLYANAYGDSISEVNEALRGIGDVIAFDALSDTELTNMAAQALDVAKILDEDVGRAVRGTSQLMRTGLASSAEQGFDLIVTAARRVPQEMSGELIDTIEEYGSSFSELGLTGEQALAAVSNAVVAGARNVDLAADAFKEFSILSIDGSERTAEAFENLGFDAETMANRIAGGGADAAAATSEVIQALSGIGDDILQENIGTALFGTTPFEDLGADVIAAMDPAIATLGDFEGAAQRAGDTLNDNLSTRLETLKRKGLAGLAELAERFVVPALEGLASLVEEVSAAFGENGFAGVLDVLKEKFEPVISFVRDNAEVFAGFGAAILTILVPAFVSWAIAAGSAAIATIAAAAPIIAVAAAIGLLVAGLVYAYRNSETFRNVVDKVVDILQIVIGVIKDVVGWLVDNLVSAFRTAWEWIDQYVIPALALFVEKLVELGTRAWEISQDVIEFLGDIVSFVQDLPGNIVEAAKGMWDGITQPFRDAMDAIRELWNSTVGGFTISLPDWLPLYGGNSFSIPTLHDGGTVPGPPGSEHLYVLEGGERVLTADQDREMRRALDVEGDGTGGGRGLHIDQIITTERPLLEELDELYALHPAAAG